MIKSLYIIPVFILICFYLMIAPLHFQGGDTAELINAGYHLYVPHPPGYPLFTWLQYFWLHTTSFSTVFFRASILSVLFSIFAISFLFMPFRKNIILVFIPIVFLGMNPDFVESTVLPDVFSLHGLFVAAILSAFLYEFKYKSFIIPFLFCVSFANHHTTVLLLPVVMFQMKEFKRAFWLGLMIGSLSCGMIYCSLLIFNHSHPYSWGNINSVNALLNHFLRQDYGTFSLAAKGSNQGFKALIFLLKSLVPSLALLGLILIRSRNLLFDKKILVLFSVLILCFIFTLIGNVVPEQVGEEVLKRFHVMPLIILVSLICYTVKNLDSKKIDKYLFLILILSTCIMQGFQLRHFIDLRNDSIIEDYSRNLFQAARKNSPALIYVNSDTAFFGIRYVTSFLGNIQDQKVAVMTPEMFFHPWFYDKVRSQLPKFELINKDKIYLQKKINIEEDIIRPNLRNYNILMTGNYKEGTWFKLVYLPIGRLMQPGLGTFFDSSSIDYYKINYAPADVPKGPQYFTKGVLFHHYSHIYLAQAHQYWVKNELSQAKLMWEKAIGLVPYALAPRLNLCQHFPNQYDFCHDKTMLELASKTKGFY